MNKNILDINETLKKNDYRLFLVVRRNHYIELEDKRVNTGLYTVSEILCTDEHYILAAIHNFSHTLKDDENAVLTDNEAYAYFYCNQLNQSLVDEMGYEFKSSSDFNNMKSGPFEEIVGQMLDTVSEITFTD